MCASNKNSHLSISDRQFIETAINNGAKKDIDCPLIR